MLNKISSKLALAKKAQKREKMRERMMNKANEMNRKSEFGV
jgi:predicted DNA-binding protein YlxM (UPF0122 family)